MKRLSYGALALFVGLAGGQPVAAEQTGATSTHRVGVENANRARFNYMMNCQGCHGAKGAGTPDGSVPTMENFVANFLVVEGGREFLLRVPGVASAPVSDVELAELTNWMLWEISPAQVPSDFQPITAEEVAHWRTQPLRDVTARRAELIEALAAKGYVETGGGAH